MLRGALRTLINLNGRKYQHTLSTGHSKLINTTESNGVREINLKDEKTRNSLSMAMMDEILQELTCGWENDNLRCIVISSTGPIFSAGHNLKELVPERGIEFHRQVFAKCSEIIFNIIKAPVPVIAKVDGLVAAAGLQLVSSCDIVVCSTQSSFSTPGANFGIFCSTPGIALSRAIPHMKSSYMLFTGLPITAQEALASGLVSSVVSSERLDNEVKKVCAAITAKSREVVKLGKEFYYRQLNMGIEEAYKAGVNVMAGNLSLDDGKEGIRSFIYKRKPQWKS